MEIITKNTVSPLIDIKKYRFPKNGESQVSFPTIRPPLPCKKGNVNFDIYDFKMIFSDEATKKIIREGKTIGCFYIESPGMRSLLKQLKCDTFEMLTAASSVIRPGVAESGMMQEFIARHKNPNRRKYLVPQIENYLGETYGIMIYQEDVIKVAHHIAGLTLEEADLLRRAMSGKMRSHKAMEGLKNKFFYSSKVKGLSPKDAKELWRQIESFAGYAFCKAHSASFALLSFQVAYLKAHHPAEFMASVLSNRGGYYSTAVYIQECKRMGLKILLPSINKSNYKYYGNSKKIQMGFMAIKNLSKTSIDKFVYERKNNGNFVSLADFVVRTKLGYEETALLIKCGSFDYLPKTRPTLMRLLDIYIHHKKLSHNKENNLFSFESLEMEQEVETERQYSIEKICTIEYETFGFMVTRHPLHFFPNIINHSKIIKAKNMHKYNSKTIKIVGWFMSSKRIKTRNGKIMKFLSLEDLTDTFEAVIFPKVYNKYAELTISRGPYIIEGKVDLENGNNIIVEKLEVVSNKSLSLEVQKDSVENTYYGDTEIVNKTEFTIVNLLNHSKLQHAYL